MSASYPKNTSVCFPMNSSRASWPCRRIPQLQDSQHDNLVRNSCASSLDAKSSSPSSSPIHLSSRSPRRSPASSPVGGSRHTWRFTGGATCFDYHVQRSLSDLQSNHQTLNQTPTLASRQYENAMVSTRTDHGVTAFELQDILLALERHKQEQHTALLAMTSELDARISTLERKLQPIQNYVEIMQSRHTHEQERLDDILMQIKRDLLTTRANFTSSIMRERPDGDLFHNFASSTKDSPTPCPKDSSTCRSGRFIKSLTGNVKHFVAPIIEHNEFDVKKSTQELPNRSGAITDGAKGGKQLEQKLGSPEGAANTFKHIMENPSGLETAASGLALGSTGRSLGIDRYEDDGNSTCDISCERGKTHVVNYGCAETDFNTSPLDTFGR